MKDNLVKFKNIFVPLTSIKAIHFIIIVGFIAFSNMLINGFVWDDKIYIIHNPGVHSINLFDLIGPNSFNNIGQYRPIPAIYFAALYSVFGELSFFYHLPQLILHITNSILVFYLLKKFFTKNLSLLLSLIFLVHPIQVESVSFVAATISPMFFIFGITALLFSTGDKISVRKIVFISFLILVSLLTKETGILFIFVILLYRVLFNKPGKLLFIISMTFTFLTYLAIRFGASGIYFESLQNIPLNRLALSERFLNIPEIIFYYFKTLVFPISLAHNQLWVITQITFRNFYFPLFAVCTIFILIFLAGPYIRKKSSKLFKAYIFFLFWFSIGLVLHLNIFPLDQTVADRWFYFPLVGLLGILGVGLELIINNRKQLTKVIYIVLAVVIVIFSIRTIVRNTNWSDAITLYTHDMKIHNNFDIENNLATEYLILQKYDKALLHFEKSTQMFPIEVNFFNLAYTYEQKGDRQIALQYYKKAYNAANSQKNNKPDLTTFDNLSRLLLFNKSYDEASTIINQGMQYYPDSANLWKYLGIVLYQKGEHAQALEAAKRAFLISPRDDIKFLIELIQNKKPLD